MKILVAIETAENVTVFVMWGFLTRMFGLILWGVFIQ